MGLFFNEQHNMPGNGTLKGTNGEKQVPRVEKQPNVIHISYLI